MEQAYFGSKVAKTLGIGESTLRKYCKLLENHSYHFDRGTNNSRVFYAKDVLLLEQIVAKINQQGIAVEQAIELAIASTQQTDVATAATVEQADTERLDRIEERQKRMEEMQTAILKHLQKEAEERKRERYEQREKESKRDEQFMSIIRAMQEEKRLIAASKQDIPLWKRLFWWRK